MDDHDRLLSLALCPPPTVFVDRLSEGVKLSAWTEYITNWLVVIPTRSNITWTETTCSRERLSDGRLTANRASLYLLTLYIMTTSVVLVEH